MYCYLIFINYHYLCKKIKKDMVKLINSIILSLTGTLVLVCSTGLAFETCYKYALEIQLMFMLATFYTICMVLYINMCNDTITHYVLANISKICQFNHVMVKDNQSEDLDIEERVIAKQRLDLFHSQYEIENKRIQQEQSRNDKQKFMKVSNYTRSTFIRLGFNRYDVFKICESVEYLVNNNAVLKHEDFHVTYNSHITQISLKNFAWNIANQYGLSRDLAAEFVMTTFSEWFKNTTRTTVVKTLRTTLGAHEIEINEKLV